MGTTTAIKQSELVVFQIYCWGFYAPGALYGDTFNDALTRDALDAACIMYVATVGDRFLGDSFDRECVRELLALSFDRKRLARLAVGFP